MKKWLFSLAALLFSTFISNAHAQETPLVSHWTNTGVSSGYSIWIDIENIRPVSLPDQTSPIPDMYYISTRFGNDPQEPLKEESVIVDLRSGAAFPHIAGKPGSWVRNSSGVSALVDFAYIYNNKYLIDHRPPYLLNKEEASFPERTPLAPIDSEGWKISHINKDGSDDKIKVDTIQVTSPTSGNYPGIRFLAQISINNADSAPVLQMRIHVEVDPNQIPQEYRILSVQALDRESGAWRSYNTAQEWKDMTESDPIHFLATSAYQYAITHTEEVESRGYFVFGEKIAPR